MPDDVTLNAGGGGDTLAADDIGGVKHQRVKIEHGADGAATDVSTASPLPVNCYIGGTAFVGGAGAVAAGVQRTTLASDDPAVVALQIMDDWDESNRAMVNPIVGQAGIAAGAGAVGVTVPRTTLASDDPAVVALQIIDDWDESNRAMVNPIVGQAGIAAGSGVDGVTVPRVTLATDVALPAGTNAIGKLGANSGVDIGDVDVTSIVPGTAATNLGKAEDAAHSSSDVGVMALGVRNDDLASLGGADGDYVPPQFDSEGALYVNPAAAEIKRASGVAAGGAPGADDIVAAVAARYIRVLALALVATSTTVNNVFVDNVDNDLWFNAANPLPLSLDADGDTVPGFVLDFNPGGWFQTDAVNEAVTLNSSAAQDVAWTITYIEVP